MGVIITCNVQRIGAAKVAIACTTEHTVVFRAQIGKFAKFLKLFRFLSAEHWDAYGLSKNIFF